MLRRRAVSRRFPTSRVGAANPGPMATSNRVSSVVSAAALAIAVGLVTYGVRGNFQFNLTSSLPIGVYRRIPGAPARGDVIVACLPHHAGEFARGRGYVWRGDCPGGAAPVGKTVLAVQGDTVRATPQSLFVNGTPVPNSRVLARDSRGRPIPHYPFGSHIVGPGEVWLFSPYHPLSFDSRYFGPIELASVKNRVSPLWTFRTQRKVIQR